MGNNLKRVSGVISFGLEEPPALRQRTLAALAAGDCSNLATQISARSRRESVSASAI